MSINISSLMETFDGVARRVAANHSPSPLAQFVTESVPLESDETKPQDEQEAIAASKSSVPPTAPTIVKRSYPPKSLEPDLIGIPFDRVMAAFAHFKEDAELKRIDGFQFSLKSGDRLNLSESGNLEKTDTTWTTFRYKLKTRVEGPNDTKVVVEWVLSAIYQRDSKPETVLDDGFFIRLKENDNKGDDSQTCTQTESKSNSSVTNVDERLQASSNNTGFRLGSELSIDDLLAGGD
jgi:hypothetical protein